MYVEQIMSRNVDSVTEDTKLSQTAKLMTEKGHRFLPVVNDKRQLVGLFSHKELAKSEPSAITTLSVGEVNYLTAKVTIGQIMQKRPLTCTPSTLVEEAGHLMRQQKVGCLPVVDNDQLVGVITEDDILDFLLDITGCTAADTARIAVHLQDEKGELCRLLSTINEFGGYIATVVSPMARDESGQRIAIVRFKSADPGDLDRHLREQGYDLITEELPSD
ncbi:MAG: CBS domain-containing protein [Gammaproteobacteria bacterium]|nr:CBS domain-containing protein [Gammaproteobacteria bacterium]